MRKQSSRKRFVSGQAQHLDIAFATPSVQVSEATGVSRRLLCATYGLMPFGFRGLTAGSEEPEGAELRAGGSDEDEPNGQIEDRNDAIVVCHCRRAPESDLPSSRMFADWLRVCHQCKWDAAAARLTFPRAGRGRDSGKQTELPPLAVGIVVTSSCGIGIQHRGEM